ncbi:MAG: methylated-DNA--[protein]-cysteine S-methyltransferase [Planctomycetota bacterium]
MADILSTLHLDGPLGALELEASNAHLVAIRWEGEPVSERSDASTPRAATRRGSHGVLDEAARQLEAYFAGELRAFDLPLGAEGTPFQREVWSELVRIPYGRTTTYGAIARTLGDAKRARAVGAAGGRNPLPIVVPCHRVLGADGALTGFAGGLRAKHWLLEHESPEPTLPFAPARAY